MFHACIDLYVFCLGGRKPLDYIHTTNVFV